MKLQDLDKTKRYDLSECTDEELLCVLNWLQNDDEEWCYCETSDLHNSQLEYCKTGGWYYNFIEKGSIKPTFIQSYKSGKQIILNKQDQFLNELQQLCKKYDANILFTDTEIRQSAKLTVQIETKNL